MKRILYFTFSIFSILTVFTSCWWQSEGNSTKITGNYYLHWVDDKSDQSILRSSGDGKSGFIQVPETVYAVGYNDSYIIAKQHPNLEKEIGERLFNNFQGEDYLLTNPSDTIYLSKDDKVYEKNGKWYHTSNGWNPPDSLKPYRGKTLYHIIDINNEGQESYVLDNEEEFLNKREELGIPKDLDFTIIDKELE